MSYLSGRIPELLIIPVICGTEQGTAFFIEESRLLTARHVVRGYFNSKSAPDQILLKLPGRDVLCKAEELMKGGVTIDVAILTIVDGEDYKSEDVLTLLKDEFVRDLSLKVYGYPREVAMGETLVTLDVRNRLTVNSWNDRTVVREDKLELKYYDGLSGAPVVNKEGRVVGIVTIQINQTLSYLSVEKLQSHLDDKGVVYDTDWETEDDTLLGLGRSYQFCGEAVKTVGDRYMPQLHQPDDALTLFLDKCTDAKKIEEKARLAEKLALFVSQLSQKKKDIIRDDLKISKALDYDLLIENGFTLLEKCCYYIGSGRFRNHLSMTEDITFNKLDYEMEVDGFDWARGKHVNNICLIGKAGAGKTHTLCHYSLHKQEQANIYIFFGTDFKPHESVIGYIKDTVCQGKTFEDYNQGLLEKGRYAVIIIDAINEGLGCSFWNNNLGGLRSELEHYSQFRLIISVRTPFDQELVDLSEERNWKIRRIDGFVDQNQAIDDYFNYYKVDQWYKGTNIEGFKNPLFLKIFCETYHSMTDEERRNATKRTLYKKYVSKKNDVVSDLVDEDPEINITDRYLSKLANYSVFYAHCNPLLRPKARIIGQRLCPGRFWKKDLMHACLSTNLLLDDRSAEGEKAVMFEYDNLGDYYKAEQWLVSKMDSERIVEWIVDEDEYLRRHQEVPRQKFEGAVKALFDCWWHAQEDVSKFRQLQSDGSLYNLYLEFLNESDIPLKTYLDLAVRLDKDQVNPIQLIRDFDSVSLDKTLQIHAKLLAYPTVGNRDVIWTRYVNQMYDIHGDEYVGPVPVEEDPEQEISDEERKYLICTTWMLSSSHPRFRAILIRKIWKILRFHKSLVEWLMGLFEDVNDPYVQAGLYCALYGVVLISLDKELLKSIAGRVYHRFYEHDNDVPQDLIVRQWTLKIIERAFYLDKTCDYWTRIKTPFRPFPFDETAVPDYWEVKSNRSFFGLQQGSMMMHASIYSLEDFNRYIIGTNSHSNSTDYYTRADDGKYYGVPLNDIMAELAYYIVKVFGWNDKLGYLDNGKYSISRSHNEKERIGKKFQWLAWYRLNARMMDVCRVSREQYFYGDKAEEKDLTKTPMPWNSSEVSRFDPTLDSTLVYTAEAGLKGTEILQIAGGNEEDWINNNAYLPVFRYKAQDENDIEYVLLMGYDKGKGEDGKETFLFINGGFVHQEDAGKYAEWSKNQNFYGRWMPERRGMTEFLWSEYPWSDAYKTVNEGYEVWEQPQDCPVKMMLSYEAQLQEDWEGIDNDKEYLTTVYMPCREMMEQKNLYCSEIRGVIKSSTDHKKVVAVNTGSGNCINGLFVRKDVLDEYLRANGYEMFYYLLGEKVQRIGSINSIMKELSAAYQYKSDGNLETIQPMRVIERELPKRAKHSPVRAAELRKKNDEEGLTTREMLELAEMDGEETEGNFIDAMKQIDAEEADNTEQV